jgi:hypothetical protein
MHACMRSIQRNDCKARDKNLKETARPQGSEGARLRSVRSMSLANNTHCLGIALWQLPLNLQHRFSIPLLDLLYSMNKVDDDDNDTATSLQITWSSESQDCGKDVMTFGSLATQALVCMLGALALCSRVVSGTRQPFFLTFCRWNVFVSHTEHCETSKVAG